MHEYSISHHDRKNAYYLIAILSGSLGTLIAYLIGAFQNTYGVAIAAPSGLVIFGLVFLLFDHFVWRWSILYKLGLVKIPNLNGTWDALITSSVSTGECIDAKINIHQTYSKIRIRLETDKSHSFSQMAAFEMVDPTYFNLRYEYSAEYQRDHNAEILRHYGVTCLRLKSENHFFSTQQSATYYTEQGRDSYGTITVTKKKGQPK
jgi:hypothetical protein